MTIETNRSKIVSETPDQTRIRLAELMTRLTNKRIDLVRAERGIATPYHPLASGYSGNISEAMSIVDHLLFNTWQQIHGTDDSLLASIAEQERGRLRDFFNTPLDDR